MFNGIFPNAVFPRDSLLYWDGGTSDRVNKRAFTYTNTAAGTRIHRATSTTFNGTTSLIDCGADLAGVGNITLLGWFNAVNFGESNLGSIANNGRLIIRVNTTNAVVSVTSDGSTFISSATNTVVAATEIFIAVTRTSTGVVNIYKNGALSGSADQASGTPAAGTTNLIIGNNAAASATFNGTISGIRIFSQILTTTQIGQIYNIER